MMKELDELITYIETGLVGDNPNAALISEAIKSYAELWHKKQLSSRVDTLERACKLVVSTFEANAMECNTESQLFIYKACLESLKI
jgi:hypothetical protein